MGLTTEAVGESAIVAISQVSRNVAPGNEATAPIAPHEPDGSPTDPPAERDSAPDRHGDGPPRESIEPAADREGGRSFASRIGTRAVLLPLACVAALLVGFGSVTAVMKLTDRPAQSDTKPVPTTAPPSAPAITTPPTTAARTAAVQSEPPPPSPEPVPAPAPEPVPAPEPAPAPEAASKTPTPPSSSSSSPPSPSTTTPSP
jgi:hypothetical protein